MARDLNIVSFNDTKRSSRSERARDLSYSRDYSSASRDYSSARGSRPRRRTTPSWYDADEAREKFEALRTPDSTELDDSQTSSSTHDRRRQRSKARAERLYERQFASSAIPDDGPRAALYKGKMGATQRKASRMQEKGGSPSGAISHGASAAGAAASGVAGAAADVASNAALKGVYALASRTSITPLSLKIITALVCIAFACVFLYTPTQQWYQAQREHDRLMAEYNTIQTRNEALDVQNDIMTSNAGIEDAVRQKYGYVQRGEKTAIVTGLSAEATNSMRDSEHIEANVLSSSVKAPDQWYSPILDALFAVE